MPSYLFECGRCHTEYSDLCSFDKTGEYPEVKCPECGSIKKTQLLTACNFIFSQPEGTSRWISDQKGHDYRYKHKVPSVRAERERAADYTGNANPYPHLDDISSGEHFGEVK